jgi:hypothetical protein
MNFFVSQSVQRGSAVVLEMVTQMSKSSVITNVVMPSSKSFV